jgi:hypothetical protein
VRASHLATLACLSLLFAVLPAPARAQSGDASTPIPGGSKSKPESHGGVSGLDVMTATVFQDGQSAFSGIAVRLRLQSALLVPNIEIMPEIEYWRDNTQIKTYGIETSRKDATLALGARWTFFREHWQPYLGAGLAAHFIDERANAPTLGVYDEHDSKVVGGYSLSGGILFILTDSMSNFLELEHHGVADNRQLKFSAGLGWNF